MSTADIREQETTELLRTAALWRLLGLLLERPRPGWHDEVRALAGESDDNELRDAAERAMDTDERAYLQAFGPGGAVSPREVRYRGYRDPGQVLADVRCFYDAFSFVPRAEDPIDHVAVEAGFVGYLHLKLAFAVEGGLAGEAETTRAAIVEFLRSHLGTFIGAVADGLEGFPVEHLARVARAAARRVEQRGLLSDERPGATSGRAAAEPGDCGGCTFPDDPS